MALLIFHYICLYHYYPVVQVFGQDQIMAEAGPEQDGNYAAGQRNHYEEFAATVQSPLAETTPLQLVNLVYPPTVGQLANSICG